LKLHITVDGKKFEVEVEATEADPRPTAQTAVPRHTQVVAPPPVIPAAGASVEQVADESKVCRSPVAGVVVKVPVQVGQSIQPNDLLMVLEAMKMETVISSPIAGKILQVNAAEGDAVKNGQVLVEFE
jgi:methylmalonyl-CoA carboxyltransferase small subunit